MIYLQDRQIAVIGIDHGYGNIKTANTITPTGVSIYTSEPLFHGDTLIFNGAYSLGFSELIMVVISWIQLYPLYNHFLFSIYPLCNQPLILRKRIA